MSHKISSLAFDEVKEQKIRAAIVEVDFAQHANESVKARNVLGSFLSGFKASDDVVEIGGRIIVSF